MHAADVESHLLDDAKFPTVVYVVIPLTHKKDFQMLNFTSKNDLKGRSKQKRWNDT